MLRVTMSVSAKGATKYFDAALRTSDYYASEHGVWGGKGAKRLGLAGDVSREDFVALASNKIPGSKDENLTVRTKDKRTAGYDFCFSVPKSVSVYLAHTGDRGAEHMIHESFRETMTDIESRMETRVRGASENGEERDYNRTTDNLIYASFVHTVTRPIDGIPDPHYHIHAFTFNATFDSRENHWKAGQFMNLKADAPFYQAAFNARLASKIIKSGYGIRRTDRDFELASVSRELIEKFSKRTRAIEQFGAREIHGHRSQSPCTRKAEGMEFADAFAQIKSELGAQSREKKSAATLDPAEQLANWRSQMTLAEWDSLLLASVKGTVSQNLVEGEAAKDLAIDHLFERASVARELHAAGMLLRRGIGRVSVEEARLFTKTDVRFVRPDPDGALITTREVLAEESAMTETARAGQGKFQTIGCGEKWTILSPVVAQSEEQIKAVHEVLRSRDLCDHDSWACWQREKRH